MDASSCFFIIGSCVICIVLLGIVLSYELVVPFQTVLKGGSMVGGLNELHTQEITMIKAGEVSQYGGPWELLSEVYLKHACNL